MYRPDNGIGESPAGAVLDRAVRLIAPGRLAQLGERQLDKLEVTGSSPVAPIWGSPMLPKGVALLGLKRRRGARCRVLQRS